MYIFIRPADLRRRRWRPAGGLNGKRPRCAFFGIDGAAAGREMFGHWGCRQNMNKRNASGADRKTTPGPPTRRLAGGSLKVGAAGGGGDLRQAASH